MANIGTSGGWSQEQLHNAQIIINVGEQMGMQQRDIRVALMTAMQESGLQNLDYGDADSLGLFQQRPSQGWGTEQQVTDPQYAASAFYRALKGIGDRDSLRLTQEAQAVQRSAYPDAYAQWADDAAGILQQLGFSKDGGTGSIVADPTKMADEFAGFKAQTQSFAPQPITAGLKTALASTSQAALSMPKSESPLDFSDVMMPTYGSHDDFLKAQGVQGAGWRHDIVQQARTWLGVPYVWGGTSRQGVDCSGFTQLVFKKFGIDLPRVSYEQANAGKRISLDNLKPGDLVFWDFGSEGQNPQGADHVAIYIGHGRVIQAPRPGEAVSISDMYDTDQAWGVRIFRG